LIDINRSACRLRYEAPHVLQTDKEETAAGLDALRQLVGAVGALNPEGERRFARVEKLFGRSDRSA
jgi:hypothetical protein